MNEITRPVDGLKAIAQLARAAINSDGETFVSEDEIFRIAAASQKVAVPSLDEDADCLKAIASIVAEYEGDEYPGETDIEEIAVSAINKVAGSETWSATSEQGPNFQGRM